MQGLHNENTKCIALRESLEARGLTDEEKWLIEELLGFHGDLDTFASSCIRRVAETSDKSSEIPPERVIIARFISSTLRRLATPELLEQLANPDLQPLIDRGWGYGELACICVQLEIDNENDALRSAKASLEYLASHLLRGLMYYAIQRLLDPVEVS